MPAPTIRSLFRAADGLSGYGAGGTTGSGPQRLTGVWSAGAPVVGDSIFLFVDGDAYAQGGPNMATPSGWTLQRTNVATRMFSRTADGTAADTPPQLGWDGGAGHGYVVFGIATVGAATDITPGGAWTARAAALNGPDDALTPNLPDPGTLSVADARQFVFAHVWDYYTSVDGGSWLTYSWPGLTAIGSFESLGAPYGASRESHTLFTRTLATATPGGYTSPDYNFDAAYGGGGATVSQLFLTTGGGSAPAPRGWGIRR